MTFENSLVSLNSKLILKLKEGKESRAEFPHGLSYYWREREAEDSWLDLLKYSTGEM